MIGLCKAKALSPKRIENFYAEQIKNILEAEGKQDQLDEEKIKAITEKINCVVLSTVEMEADRLVADSKLKGMAKQLLKTSPLMVGVSLAIGSIGLPIAITGLMAGGASWAIRRMVAERSKKSASKSALEQGQRAADARVGVLAEMFSEENLEKFLSNGLISKEGDKYIIDLKKLGCNKLLGNGIVTKKFKVTAKYASGNAVEKVKNAGGEVVLESVKEVKSSE